MDTNIFLRYFVDEDPAKKQACFALFQRAKRKEVSLTTSESVIAEIVFILSSKKHYNLTPEDIKQRLYPILALRGLKLPHRQVFMRALDLYTQHQIDFEDCLTISHMECQKLRELYSYDSDFDNLKGLSRMEP